MAAIPLHPCTTTTATGKAAGEATFLRLDDPLLTAGQVVLALGSYLADFGDNLHGEATQSTPLSSRFLYGDLHSWQQTNTPKDAVAVLARTEQVTRDCVGRTFPVINLMSRP